MTYVIQPGDTIKSIARKFGVSEESIVQANREILDPNILIIGGTILIPSPRQEEPMEPEIAQEVETAVSPCPTLRIGSRGAAVVRLQTLLISNGFNPGTVDGIFGSRTDAAVRAFQAARGLTVDGIVGVQTWTALGVDCQAPPPPPPPPSPSTCPLLRRGSRGTAVSRLQQLLNQQGFSLVIDGIFGSRTEGAVIAFQRSRNLPATGIVDVPTWEALGVNCMAPPPPPPINCPLLRRGSRGSAVATLQQLLNQRGFGPGVVTGFFGPRTEAAVRAFQAFERLPVTGIVDVATWQALGVNCQGPQPVPCPTLRLGSRGAAVIRLQQLLTTNGFSPGAIDGIFGSRTDAAVRAFQAARGLRVDGIVGIQTWTALGVNCMM